MNPWRSLLATCTVLVPWLVFAPRAAAAGPDPAELILSGGRVWTVDPNRPEARAVAIRGGVITAVGDEAEVLALRGPETRVIDLAGRLVLPGFNDAHTHFGNAADWYFHVALYDTNDPAEIATRLAEAASRLPAGLWITGGDWGAHAAWKASLSGGPAAPPLVDLDLARIDAATPDHPVLLKRHDGAWFANTVALERGRFFTGATPDPAGGRIGRDASGRANGMLYGRAGERMQELMPPASLERTLVGARLALAELARDGITSIGDVARLDELSQRQLFHTDVERSATNLDVFRELQRRGQLSVRVYAYLTLALWSQLADVGVTPGSEQGLIRFGGLKGFIDGYLMEEPYLDTPGYAGAFTFRFVDPESMQRDVVGADRLGFDPVVHTIGDKAHRLLLDWFEAAIRVNPPRDRRFRIIHAWYPSAADVERAGRLGVVADVTPYHLIRGLGSIEKRLGERRSRTAHAWRALADAGVRLNLVSDWPGSYNERVATPVDPLENIAYAVTRARADGTPAGGWHPDQALSVEEAIEAYTRTPAWSSYELDRKGTITPGKWADLVVVSDDILTMPPERIREARVECTFLAGRLVYPADCVSGEAGRSRSDSLERKESP